MAFKTADGKHKSSKFRASRYDREHAEEKEPKGESEAAEEKENAGGPRSQMNRMEAKKPGNPEEHPMGEEEAEEAINPGIHEEIKGVMAQHGPAHTIHMTHDHEGMRSHVHSVHADGHEHHAHHEGEEHVKMAHEHAGHAAGAPMGEQGETQQSLEVDHAPNEESYAEPL